MTEKKLRPYKNPQINLRIPQDLKDEIQKIADKSNRSMNAEIIEMLKFAIEYKNSNKSLIQDDFFLDNPEDKIESKFISKDDLRTISYTVSDAAKTAILEILRKNTAKK